MFIGSQTPVTWEVHCVTICGWMNLSLLSNQYWQDWQIDFGHYSNERPWTIQDGPREHLKWQGASEREPCRYTQNPFVTFISVSMCDIIERERVLYPHINPCLPSYLHYMHTCIFRVIRVWRHVIHPHLIHPSIHTYIHAPMHTYIDASMHALIHAYMPIILHLNLKLQIYTYTYTIKSTIHYMAIHDTAMHYHTFPYIPIHYHALSYITMDYITLNHTALHYIMLHYITLHCMNACTRCTALHWIRYHSSPPPGTKYHYIPSHITCPSFRFYDLCIALYYMVLHYNKFTNILAYTYT